MELSLKRLAMITVGTSYWLRVGKKSMYYCITGRMGGYPQSLYWVPLKWKDGPETYLERFNDVLAAKVKDDFKGIGLPKENYDELFSVIILLGQQSLEWHQQLKKTVPQYLNPRSIFKCHDLSYNPYGLIDEKKMADKVIENLEKEGGSLRIFHRCCGYASRSYIHRNMDSILHVYDDYFYSDTIYPISALQTLKDFVLYSVVFFCDKRKLSLRKYALLKEYNFGKLNCSKVVYMFSLAVSGGFEVAVEYFWRLMDQRERDNQILSAASTCVEEYNNNMCSQYQYNGLCYVNILVRFYMIMSEELRKEFLLFNHVGYKSKAILIMFLRYWPLQELFFPAFDVINSNCDYDIIWYYDLVEEILDSMDYMHAMGVDFKTVKLDQILYTVCSEIEKRFTFDTEVSYDFNDFKLRALIKTERYDLLKKILELSFKSAQERQELVQKLNFREFALENKWIALVKFLNFWSMLFEEPVEFTYKTDFMALCVELVVIDDIMLADDILGFSFQNAGRQVQEFDCNWLTIIWKMIRNDEIINKSPSKGGYDDSKFAPFCDSLKKGIKRTVEWLLKNHFQINQIFSEKILKEFVQVLVSDFIVACMALTPVDITCELLNTFLARSSTVLLKREIQLNINDWRLIFSKRDKYVNEIEKLENWIFNNEE